MICVSIAESTVTKCLEVLEKFDFAEIRLDQISAEAREMKRIFSLPKKLIATCRPGTKDDQMRKALLTAAVAAGAAFVDIEIDAEAGFREDIITAARESGCQVIISYHNYEKTPRRTELEHWIKFCFDDGADIAKIACLVHSPADNACLLGLLDEERPLIVTGMGEKGKVCRVIAPLLGSLFTYASPEAGKETAPGQIDILTLRDLLQRIKNV
jgi:3-dehydroquinate dehydratase-1